MKQKMKRTNWIPLALALFKYSIFELSPMNETTINLVILGFDTAGQKALDLLLQALQLPENLLKVTVFATPKQKETYLSQRPALERFFSIDSKKPSRYGCIEFKELNEESLEEELISLSDPFPISYLIISEEDKRQRDHLADLAAGMLNELDNPLKPLILSEHSKEMNDRIEYNINKIEDQDLYEDLLRLAFNYNLAHENNLQINYDFLQFEESELERIYDNLFPVLSIAYKLNSLGINILKQSYEASARAFAKLNLGEEREEGSLINLLLDVEHRRWVSDRLVHGWKPLEDLSVLKEGRNQKKESLEHLCLVESLPNQRLRFVIEEKPVLWNRTGGAFPVSLDPLDQLSLDQHRYYQNLADQIKRSDVLNHPSLITLKELEESGSFQTRQLMMEWVMDIEDLVQGNTKKIKSYQSLKRMIPLSLNKAEQKKAQKLIEEFDAFFHPGLAAAEYRDYKIDDLVLIETIPFVLTYRQNHTLAIPYDFGSNDRLFSNVLSPILSHPEKILYLCLIDSNLQFEAFAHSVKPVLDLLEKKNIDAKVEFFLLMESLTVDELENFNQILQEQGVDEKAEYVWLCRNPRKEALGDLEFLFSERSKGSELFILEKNSTRTSLYLEGAGFYERFASIRPDGNTKSFKEIHEAEMFSYLPDNASIQVSDILLLSQSGHGNNTLPIFKNSYKRLWKQYQQDPKLWKELTALLEDYFMDEDSIAFSLDSSSIRINKELVYDIPLQHVSYMRKLLKDLKKEGAIGQQSQVVKEEKSCQLKLYGANKNEKAFNRLLSIFKAMSEPFEYEGFYAPKENAWIARANSPFVKNLSVKAGQWQLLQFFSKEGLLKDLKRKEGAVSFTINGQEEKSLLVSAGKILEIYTYYLAKESGLFDDCAIGFEIDWADTGVKNEFDVILTKGFKTLFIECKARNKISQDFYYKLASVVEQLGVNASLVLIADTKEEKENKWAKFENSLQRKRGDRLHVITLYRKKDLQHLDQRLNEIFENSTMENL